MAEGLLRHRAKEANVLVTIDSAGTSGYHKGNPPDARMMDTAIKQGVDISYIRSRVFTTDDFDQFDRIFVMDRANLRNVLKLARNESEKEKVSLIMDIVHPHENVEVPDPYFGSDDGFTTVFNMLDLACSQLIKSIQR
jgi:protein-tyrosine phosphatase